MTEVAFCDDDGAVLRELRSLLDQYRADRDEEINCTMFHNPLELIHAVEHGARFDILFMDILMPGVNGIDAASEIRVFDKAVKIIFLTSSAEFAVQSYTVGAYFYQLKPIWRESFFRLMDSVLAACEKEQMDSIVLRCKTGVARIGLKELEYCEVVHRTLFFHLTSGKVLESFGSLDDLSAQLEPYQCFLRPHRSYLVNLEYVRNITARTVTMSCLTEIPLPRGRYNEVKDAYLEYAFRDRQVMV
ncbi:response regulator transcription factor [Oscillibacter valericigenes]|nr:response regulator transcription factor [Oscillibacter valericigenes]